MKAITTTLIGLLLSLTFASAQAELTPKEAVALLEKSVINTSRGCSGAKIGPAMFLTAGHCVSGMFKDDMKIEFGYQTVFPKSVLFPLSPKAGTSIDKDWAIIYTTDDIVELDALQFGCFEKPYLGQRVAYMGKPYPVKKFFGMGYISSIGDLNNRESSTNRADIITDLKASGGASGSPVISMDTGHVIGVLTEAVYGDRSDIYAVGLESIRNTDKCEVLIKEKEDAAKALQESGSK